MALQQIHEGHWNEVIGHVREKWGQFADDELQQLKGNTQQLVGLIQRKTGEARERVESQLREWTEQGENVAGRVATVASEAASKAGEAIHANYERVSDSMKSGYHEVENMVQHRPAESMAVAFGSGLVAGALLGLVLRNRN